MGQDLKTYKFWVRLGILCQDGFKHQTQEQEQVDTGHC